MTEPSVFDLVTDPPGPRIVTALSKIALALKADAPQYLVECLEGFACIAARRGHAERALRLSGAAAGIRESIGTPQPPWSRKLEEGWLPDLRRRVGPSATRAREEGRKLAPERAIALALEPM